MPPTSLQDQDTETDADQIKNLTLQLESQLVDMGVNAPDWLISRPFHFPLLSPMFASFPAPKQGHSEGKSARDILWDGSPDKGDVQLEDWVGVMHTYILHFSPFRFRLRYYSFCVRSFVLGAYVHITTQILIITDTHRLVDLFISPLT
jgi:hypothetical protein